MTAIEDYLVFEHLALTISQQLQHGFYLRPRRERLINHRIMARSGLIPWIYCCVAKMRLRRRSEIQSIGRVYFFEYLREMNEIKPSHRTKFLHCGLCERMAAKSGYSG
jgi:hypothetical protein